MAPSLLGMLLGLLLGARHALEPDHLAAVAVLSLDAPSPRRGALLGAFWGVGHTIALVGVALALSLFSASMPQRLADLFELGVALMLVILGIRACHRALVLGREGPISIHSHGEVAHIH